ncbi:hypothetical protein ACJX0J_029631, partial [Zea mays]
RPCISQEDQRELTIGLGLRRLDRFRHAYSKYQRILYVRIFVIAQISYTHFDFYLIGMGRFIERKNTLYEVPTNNSFRWIESKYIKQKKKITKTL